MNYRHFPVAFVMSLAACTGRTTQKSEAVKETAADTSGNKVAVAAADSAVMAPAADFSEVNALMYKRRDAPQYFTVAGNRPQMLCGKKGILINLKPEDLETTEGKPPGSEIRVSLIEMMDGADFVRNSAPTTSNGRLLASGGACDIRCSADGKELRLKSGRTLEIAFPKKNGDRMGIFYGERDATGQVNWIPEGQPAATPATDEWVWVTRRNVIFADSIIQEMNSRSSINMSKFRAWAVQPSIRYDSISGKAYLVVIDGNRPIDTEYTLVRIPVSQRRQEEIFDAFRVNGLGFINCDRFSNMPQVDLLVSADTANRLPVKVYVIFKNENSVLQSDMNPGIPGRGTKFRVPEKSPARVVAFSYDKGRLYGAAQDIATSTAGKITLHLQPISKENMERMISGKG